MKSAKTITIILYSIKEEHFVLKSILHYYKHYYKLMLVKWKSLIIVWMRQFILEFIHHG